MYRLNYPDKLTTSNSGCEICCEGKQPRLPLPKDSDAQEILQVIH